MERILKIGLAIALLVCLAKMPYGYYQFVRFSAAIVFALLSFKANDSGNQKEALLYIVLALLFQPFFKVVLGRVIWNIVDIIVAIGLIFSAINNQPQEKK